MEKKKIVILTGAGMSAESGIKTFRDEDGLWEGHDVMQVATPEGWRKNRELVLDFYNQRRKQLKEVKPNAGHIALTKLEESYKVVVITQNVDNLHERAGSSNILHLHGELTKVRSTKNPKLIYDWDGDLVLGDQCELGAQLRPHIVWFGEDVPALEHAVQELYNTHYVIIIGTSMQVYPAASLVSYAAKDARIFYIDPKPSINYELSLLDNLTVVAERAGDGVEKVVQELMNLID